MDLKPAYICVHLKHTIKHFYCAKTWWGLQNCLNPDNKRLWVPYFLIINIRYIHIRYFAWTGGSLLNQISWLSPLTVFQSCCGTVLEHLKWILFGKKAIRIQVPGVNLICLSCTQKYKKTLNTSPPAPKKTKNKNRKKLKPPQIFWFLPKKTKQTKNKAII